MWSSQVFHFDKKPTSIEFDLFAGEDVRVAEVRCEVIAPNRKTYRADFVWRPPEPILRAGMHGYADGGSYPDHYSGAKPLAFGKPYVVVWYSRERAGDDEVEVARQEFTLPLPAQQQLNPLLNEMQTVYRLRENT